MKRNTPEFYDLMKFFEANINKVVYCGSAFEKEPKELWANGRYYCNGRVNDLFLTYMSGYTHGKSVQRDGDYDDWQ